MTSDMDPQAPDWTPQNPDHPTPAPAPRHEQPAAAERSGEDRRPLLLTIAMVGAALLVGTLAGVAGASALDDEHSGPPTRVPYDNAAPAVPGQAPPGGNLGDHDFDDD